MKSTKNKLLSSIATLFVCFAMLIGSTYAWFTDSASTGVNKIQAGTLDIDLKTKNASGVWEDAEGTSLAWRKAPGTPSGEATLWEPGVTYELPLLQITNLGNLETQFQVQINGITGKDKNGNPSTKLLDALDFEITYVQDEDWLDAFSAEQLAVLTSSFRGSSLNNLPYTIDRPSYITETGLTGIRLRKNGSGADTYYVRIRAHMDKSANNDYQGLSLENIGITVVATQCPAEHDSFNDQYDKEAEYPVVVANSEQAQNSIMNTGSGDVNVVASSDIVLNLNGDYYNAKLGNNDSESVTIDALGNNITFESTYRNAINCYGKLTISNAKIDSTYKPEGSTWDDYALIFKYKEGGVNEVVFNNVIFDRQVAIEKGVKATFNNCKINQISSTGDMYALWIQAGADVTLNNCTIKSVNPNSGSLNRAIKIADEYVTDPQLTKLKVNGTRFESQKKAAVLVTSTAGANIVWGNGNDISQVAADPTNAVWNDADRTNVWNLVTVTGCTKYQES